MIIRRRYTLRAVIGTQLAIQQSTEDKSRRRGGYMREGFSRWSTWPPPHWSSPLVGINVPAWAAVLLQCSCNWDQLLWPPPGPHPQWGPAGRLKPPLMTLHLLLLLSLWPLTSLYINNHVHVLYDPLAHHQRQCEAVCLAPPICDMCQ